MNNFYFCFSVVNFSLLILYFGHLAVFFSFLFLFFFSSFFLYILVGFFLSAILHINDKCESICINMHFSHEMDS